jgi:SAM-dependent methyltransferase
VHSVSYLAHNWLILKRNNEVVERHLLFMKGIVYDLGCGVRPYEHDIMRTATGYVGIDWSNTPHELQADIVADLNEPLPVPDAVADTVVSFQVLEHLKAPQVMLNEAHRILVPGGGIVLTVPFQWWVHEAPHDYFRFTRHGLEHLFDTAGFTDIRISEVTGFWEMWFLKFNYQTARLVRGPRVMRALARVFLLPVWFLDQLLATKLDRSWPSPEETAGYVVLARKR